MRRLKLPASDRDVNPSKWSSRRRHGHRRGRQGCDRIEQDQDVVRRVESFGEAFVLLPVAISDGERNGLCHPAVNRYDWPQEMVSSDCLDSGASELGDKGGRGLYASHGRPKSGTLITL